MIIVEGTDLVGKTTLCQELVKRLNAPGLSPMGYQYQHFTRLPNGFDHYWSYVARMSRRIVCDRFHDSDLAYCHARGEGEGASLLFGLRCQLVDAKFRLHGGLKFLVTASHDVIEHRFKERGDDMYKLDVILAANDWFFKNTFRFDYHLHVTERNEYPSTSGLVDKFIDEYKKRQETLDYVMHSCRRLDGSL